MRHVFKIDEAIDPSCLGSNAMAENQVRPRGWVNRLARLYTPVVADVLDRLEGKSFARRPDAAYFEAIVEAMQQAYGARLEGLGDTEPAAEGCTTHVTAVDREGGIAALTTTPD